MKAAFAAWNERIAPVFDVARQICVVVAESGRIVGETREVLIDDAPARKALRLAELGIGTLVCGAISRELELLVAARGVTVVSFVAGDLRKVIDAWVRGRLTKDAFTMPGCRGRGDRRLGRRGGPGVAGPGGSCVCTHCGHQEAHERGIPCMQKRCPACNFALTRQ
jgi:predicted Fe-Mo cluster-binding NifX family protein